MKKSIKPKEHNKDEFPPAHTADTETSSIVLYTAEDNSIQLDVKLENDTVWLMSRTYQLQESVTSEEADGLQTHCRQYSGGSHADDCREPLRRKGYYHQTGS